MNKKAIRVLLIEDNPGDVRMVREMMREVTDLEIHDVDNLATGIELLRAQEWNVVLLDLGLPDSQGIGTLRTVIESGCSAPVVVLTGHDDEVAGRAAVREGAQDYLVKGYVAGQAITRAVRYAIERKGAEHALAESEARFRIFSERTPDGVFMVDETGRYTQANQAVCRITGYPKDELLRMSIPELLAEESLADGVALFRGLMGTGAATSDLWYKRKDGSICCLTVDAVKLSDTQVMGFCKDITERKVVFERECQIRQVLEILNRPGSSENTIHDILHLVKTFTNFDAVAIRLQEGDDFPYYLTDGFSDDFIHAERSLCERDAQGQVVRDAEGEAILECMCGNIIRRRTNPALPFFTEGGSFWSNGTTRLLAATTEADRQTRTRNRCNGEGYESVALIPLKTDGNIIGLLQLNDHRQGRFTPDMIQFFEGLSASIGIALVRQQAEEAIRSLNASLERKVQERTAQLQATNQELEAFSYSISHDLKTPLRAVTGFSQILMEDYSAILGPAGEDLLQRVQSEAVRMGVLIDDLLRLARLAHQPMMIEELDLTALAHSILATLSAQEPQRQVRTELESDMQMHGDPVLIRVLLENLLGNAWKFTSRTVDACIQVRSEPCEPGRFRFSVTDNGAGFDQAYENRLFVPFGRLHSPEEFPGTGIGLSIVRRIAHRHGALLQAVGRPGLGATFTLTFPESVGQP